MNHNINTSISNRERELVIARLEVLSPEIHFSSGGRSDTLSRDELITYIKAGDPIGDEYVKIELEFLRALRNGSLAEQLATA